MSEKEYIVLSAHYYDNPARMWPHEHEVIGRFRASNVADLRKQLADAGYEPSHCRWELAEVPANAELTRGEAVALSAGLEPAKTKGD